MLHSKAVDLMDPAEVLAGAALRAGGRAESLGTGHSGSKAFANADGTWTVVGPQAGDATLATHVGDTTPPPVPTGIAATSVDGTVAVTWDGTLAGDVPADFLRVNLYVDGVWFAALAEAGSCLTPPQEVGSTVSVTATSEDDACEWDGTPAHNVSEPCAPVEVVVRDLFAEGAAELDAAREEAREAIDAVDRTAAEAAQAVAGAVAAAGEAKDAADAASSAADELRRTAATKTEVTQAVDAAKGEVLTSVAADYVDKETGATLATKSEVSQTADAIRSEVSEGYVDKATGQGLASKSELEQTASSIRAEVARDYVDKATGATYATKSELKVESDSIRAEVGEVAETAEGAVDRAAALEVAADAIRADVASTAKTADAAISKATSVEQTASGLSAKITETATKADQTATKVTDLSATVDGVSSSVAKAQQTADGAATAASRAQQTADSITSTVEANYLKKGDAASLYAGKTEVEQTTDAIRLTAEESLRKVDNLKIGGTNLLLESDTPNRGASATGYPSAQYPLSAHVESGHVYTATLWWSGNSGGVKWNLYFGGGLYGTAWKAISGASGTSSITFTANANMAAQGYVCVYVRDSRDIASFNGSITVLQVKLEKGNTATDWSPAPEDADATYATKAALSVESDRITGVVSEQAGLANRVSTVEQKADGLTVTLGQTTDKVNTLNTNVTTLRTDYDLIKDPDNLCQLNKSTASKWGFTTRVGGANGDTLVYTVKTLRRDTLISNQFSAKPGDRIRARYWVRSDVRAATTQGGTDSVYRRVRLALRCTNEAGAALAPCLFDDTHVSSAAMPWTEVDATVTVPSRAGAGDLAGEVDRATLFLQVDGWPKYTGTIELSQVSVTRAGASQQMAADAQQTGDSALAAAESAFDAAQSAATNSADAIAQTNAAVAANASILDSFSVDELNQVLARVRVVQAGGVPALQLGSTTSEMWAQLTNTQLSFMDGAAVVAYISAMRLFISQAQVTGQLGIGGFAWVPRANGNLCLKKV